jgi:N-acetylglucosamine kinase-like BadF-type ATPase
MIIIADSGSSKTTWQLIPKSNFSASSLIYGAGINPYYQTVSEIIEELKQTLSKAIKHEHIAEIHFYGAGCHFEDKKQIVRKAIQSLAPLAVTNINNDLLGACRALFGHEKGICCILGTGSNSCYYDGEVIRHNVSPLGFILGDEGSGAALGKRFIADILKKQLPEELIIKFQEKYQLDTATVLENVYQKSFPSRYLAQFTKFIHENIHHNSIRTMIYESFQDFFIRNVMQYDNYTDLPVGFVGSVAYFFSDILTEAGNDLGITISAIEQSPMNGLLSYHLQP